MGGTRVELTVSRGTALLTIDGPDTRNALDAHAADDLIAACDEIDANAGVGAAIVTGAGRAFWSLSRTRKQA